MMTGAAAAMLYSEEEIRSVFSKEDADEFMEIRRQAKENFAPHDYTVSNYDEELPMAAEEESEYWHIPANLKRGGTYKKFHPV